MLSRIITSLNSRGVQCFTDARRQLIDLDDCLGHILDLDDCLGHLHDLDDCLGHLHDLDATFPKGCLSILICLITYQCWIKRSGECQGPPYRAFTPLYTSLTGIRALTDMHVFTKIIMCFHKTDAFSQTIVLSQTYVH